MMVNLPPFDGWLFVAYHTLHTGFRYLWIMMCSGVPVSALPVAALALAAFWLWVMHRCIPALGLVLAMW
jgi:hypothetical protein